MTLTGTYLRNLDDKRRLAVPKRLRDQFPDEEAPKLLYIAPGTDQSLVVYSPAPFERLAKRLARKSSNRVEVRTYLRLFYSRAEQVDIDSQGRVRIPDRLAEFAQLERDLVLLGVHDHAEIWNPERWQTFLDQHNQEFDDMASQAFE